MNNNNNNQIKFDWWIYNIINYIWPTNGQKKKIHAFMINKMNSENN